MADLTIHLRTDPATGKKEILVELSSDVDAMPLEHEQHHRELVQKLIEGGLLSAEDAGQVVVSRPEGGDVGLARPATAEEVEEVELEDRGQ